MNTASAPTTDEPSLSARDTIKALWAYLRPHRRAVAVGLLCALAGATGGLLQPLATKALVDRLASGRTIAGILIALTALVVLGTAVEAIRRVRAGADGGVRGPGCETHPCRTVAAATGHGVGAISAG